MMSSAQEYDRVASEIRRPGAVWTNGILDIRELIRYATLAASSHNTQPWKFHIRKNSITILPDFKRTCPVVDPDNSHLFKSLGCAAENLVHAAGAQGFSADVRLAPDSDGIVIVLNRGTSARATDLFRAITRRQCVRTPYDGTPLEVREFELLEKAGQGDIVRTIMLSSKAQKDSVIDYVTRGNIAQLTDQVFLDELVSWIRFNPREALDTRDGLAGRANGQPPLPTWLAKSIIGWVLNPRRQADTDARNIRSSSGVAIFVSSCNDKTAWVEAGRVYQRFALQATVLDIRTAFINQPIEVRSLRPQFESWLNLKTEHTLLIVRYGHGPTVPFSLRRPIDDVMIME